MNIKPLADRVLILPAPTEEKTNGGIIIPDPAKEKPLQGEVVTRRGAVCRLLRPDCRQRPCTVQSAGVHGGG